MTQSQAQSQSQTPPRIWASLITNMGYLPGLLTLHHSLYNPTPDPRAESNNNQTLPSTPSRYPFVAFYTSTFPPEGIQALQSRGISAQLVPSVTPASTKTYTQDPRFSETWNKLVAFSLTEYERVVLLDGDILVRRNMDELMDIELDEGERVFAASHACACNPMKKPHYPETWVPANCAFTTQHPNPSLAQRTGAPSNAGVAMLNSGVLVIQPSAKVFKEITTALQDAEKTSQYDFPDQELLSEVFRDRWVALPYVYNALKTLRWESVHGTIWRDEEVKAVHYIFAMKPWHEDVSDSGENLDGFGLDEPSVWWWRANFERKRVEVDRGIEDGI